MRWKRARRSENVEDRRGMSPASGGLALGGGGLTILLVVGALLLGVNPQDALKLAGQKQAAPRQAGNGAVAPDDEAKDFARAILGYTEDVWTDLFSKHAKSPYEKPQLVLFSGTVTTNGCGSASSAVGPFYCPADNKVYIDPVFYEDLARRYKAPGDFAQAYVIAHEIGHHVQNLLGISDQVRAKKRQVSETEGNKFSVRLELQADFLAGVWAHHAHKRWNILEGGDIQEAIRAANSIGDDTLQKQAQGYVIPERFTHGTSAQRERWFKKGLNSGDLTQLQQLFQIPYDQL